MQRALVRVERARLARGAIFILPALIASSAAASFKVAYVEHQATSPCGAGSCGAATKAENAKTLAAYAAQAASKGAQLIVFPEYGITGFSSFPASSWHTGGYSEAVPPPPAAGMPRMVPCASPASFGASPTLVTLSCAAQRNAIAVVANLAEWDTVDRRGALFNTDVAFDTDGALVARYRKQNLWGEAEMTIPQTCPTVSFNTTFGVTFGLLTCADLIYEAPALTLLNVDRVRHFVMPAAWTNIDAQMQPNAWAQGWAARAGAAASLVLANHRGKDSSGSGVWAAGGHTLSFVYDTRAAEGGVQVGAVVAVSDATEAADVVVTQREVAPLMFIAPPPPSMSTAAASAAAAAVTAVGGNFSAGSVPRGKRRLRRPQPSSWSFVKLTDGAKICSSDGTQCCTASLPATTGAIAKAALEGYALALVAGTDSEEGNVWGARACAVLPCATPSRGCLSYQTPGGETSRLAAVSIELCGLATTDFVVPEVVSGGAAREQAMLQPATANSTFAAALPGTFVLQKNGGQGAESESESACWQLAVSAAVGDHVTSAVIYGRRFTQDNLPYTCPPR